MRAQDGLEVGRRGSGMAAVDDGSTVTAIAAPAAAAAAVPAQRVCELRED